MSTHKMTEADHAFNASAEAAAERGKAIVDAAAKGVSPTEDDSTIPFPNGQHNPLGQPPKR